jgi:hypothetical protein
LVLHVAMFLAVDAVSMMLPVLMLAPVLACFNL